MNIFTASAVLPGILPAIRSHLHNCGMSNNPGKFKAGYIYFHWKHSYI
ncbi:hypothetical protein ACP4OV_027418 [Aristida adscensionis]